MGEVGMNGVQRVTFNEATRKVLDGKNLATVATVNPDGGPQSSVVWVKREGDTVLISTITGRQKARNLARDPRISVAIFDRENPSYSVEIRGVAVLLEDPEKALPKELYRKYLGTEAPPEPGEWVRLVVRVTPRKVTEYSP
jgi:PPOX class probable F420-dependent enzyme